MRKQRKHLWLIGVAFVLIGAFVVSKLVINQRLITDKITVSYIKSSRDSGFVRYWFEVNDRQIVAEIQRICAEGNFLPVLNPYLGLCRYFLDFNNGTVIGIYENIDYGNLESKIESVGTAMHLPSGLNAYVKKLIAQYEAAGLVHEEKWS